MIVDLSEYKQKKLEEKKITQDRDAEINRAIINRIKHLIDREM